MHVNGVCKVDVCEYFKNSVPEQFLSAISAALPLAYSSARTAVDVQELGEDETYNVMPWTRRAHVETRLRDAAIACGLPVQTAETGFWRHVVVTCGAFKITQCTTIDEETPPRRAGYKCRYAAEQLLLPGFEASVEVELDAPHFYAVIIHRGKVLATEPSFMAVRFPTPDLSGFHPGMVDLSFYTQTQAAAVEEIETTVTPKLKGRRAVGNG
jgi:hypothetical protein